MTRKTCLFISSLSLVVVFSAVASASEIVTIPNGSLTGAESWVAAPQLQDRMKDAVRNSQAPVSFFQTENDYRLLPSRELSKAMTDAGKLAEVKIYPSLGKTAAQGHSFTWAGSTVWADDMFHFLNEHCRN